MLTDQQFHAALDRIARSDDGRTLYLFLQRRLMGVSTTETDGALRQDQGERTFAAKLIGLMATGIRESGGSNTNPDGSGSISPDQPITFAVAGPRAVSERRGAGRRVSASTHVDGYSDPDAS